MKIWVGFLSLYWILSSSTADRTRLRILSLLPLPVAPGTQSHSDDPSLPLALELAVTRINEKEGLLDGYELEVVVDDSGCNTASIAEFSFVKHVVGSKATSKNHLTNGSDFCSVCNIIGVVGPVCTESALAVAKLASKPQIALVNIHQATAPSRQPSRPYTFSIFSPVSELVAALIAFTEQAGWKRMIVFYEMSKLFYRDLFRVFSASVSTQVEMEVAGFTQVEDILFSLSALQSSGYRIILLFMDADYASEVVRLAISKGITFPNYQWILITNSFSKPECALNRTTLERAFVVYPDITKPLDTGNETNRYNLISSPPRDRLLYDSMWAFALALNNSLKVLGERGISLAEYKNYMPELSDVIRREMLKLEFNGASGYVNFGEDGFSTRPIEISQVIGNGEPMLFAQYSLGNFTIVNTSNAEIIDDRFFLVTRPTIHVAVSVIFFTFLFVHLIVLVTAHIAINVFRKESSIKASSNKMNQFVFAGNYFLIIALFLNNVLQAFNTDLTHETVGGLCHAIWPWAMSFGTTLILGSISLRTWRLYRIFIHFQDPGSWVTDKRLALLLCALLGIDIVIAIIWTATDPLKLTVLSEELTDKDGEVMIEQSVMCTCDSIQTWLIIIMFYKIVLLTALLTLAVLTREIKDKKYTTSNLRVISYTYTFTIGLGYTLFYILFFKNVEQTIDYVVLNVLLHSIIIQNEVLVLFPPLIPIVKEKLLHSRTSTESS